MLTVTTVASKIHIDSNVERPPQYVFAYINCRNQIVAWYDPPSAGVVYEPSAVFSLKSDRAASVCYPTPLLGAQPRSARRSRSQQLI